MFSNMPGTHSSLLLGFFAIICLQAYNCGATYSPPLTEKPPPVSESPAEPIPIAFPPVQKSSPKSIVPLPFQKSSPKPIASPPLVRKYPPPKHRSHHGVHKHPHRVHKSPPKPMGFFLKHTAIPSPVQQSPLKPTVSLKMWKYPPQHIVILPPGHKYPSKPRPFLPRIHKSPAKPEVTPPAMYQTPPIHKFSPQYKALPPHHPAY